MTSPEEVIQYAPLLPDYARTSPVRVSIEVTGPNGNVLFAHQCQEQGTFRDFASRLWRRRRPEPARCQFAVLDNPNSTWVFACEEPLPDVMQYFPVRMPDGFLRVLVCARHRALLEARERQFYGG